MPYNFYAGWSIEELLREQRRIQERANGGDQTEVASAGVRGVKEFPVSAETILYRIDYALYIASPDEYPLPTNTRTSRTKATAYNG